MFIQLGRGFMIQIRIINEHIPTSDYNTIMELYH